MDVLQDRLRPATNPSHIFVKANGSDENKEEENGLFWEDRSLDEQEEEESVATTTSTTTTSEGASCLQDFVQDVLVRQHGVTIVLDTIDQSRDKVAFWKACRASGISVVTTGTAKGRIDPTQVTCQTLKDISSSTTDNKDHNDLLNESLAILSQEEEEATASLLQDITCISSTEPVQRDELGHQRVGSLCTVTGAFGLAAASAILKELLVLWKGSRPTTSSSGGES